MFSIHKHQHADSRASTFLLIISLKCACRASAPLKLFNRQKQKTHQTNGKMWPKVAHICIWFLFLPAISLSPLKWPVLPVINPTTIDRYQNNRTYHTVDWHLSESNLWDQNTRAGFRTTGDLFGLWIWWLRPLIAHHSASLHSC